jgi:hypothetical protein
MKYRVEDGPAIRLKTDITENTQKYMSDASWVSGQQL